MTAIEVTSPAFAIDCLRAELIATGLAVLEQVERAVAAWDDGDAVAAARVVADDRAIDERCRDLETRVMDAHQRWPAFGEPARLLHVAVIVAVALERVGNLAVAISQCAEGTTRTRSLPGVEGSLQAMSAAAIDAMHTALEALATADLGRAEAARARSAHVPVMFRAMLDRIALEDRADGGSWLTSAILVGRHLERVAQNASELAVRAHFVVTGERPG